MDNKKFEQLIELIINENEDAAKALFHDIVVEKSREIYESMMEEEMDEGGLGGQVGSMLDEIDVEESGMTEDDMDPMDSMDDEGMEDEGMEDDEVLDLEADEEGEDGRMDDLEDRVVSAEEKLEKLMAEFEDILADDDEEDMSDDEEAADDEEMAADDEEASDDEDMAADEEEAMMEAKLIAVKKPTGGDDGANSRSVVAAKAKIASPASAVKFDTGSSKPAGTPSVKQGMSYANSSGHAKSKKLSPAPKAHTKDTTHSRSPLGESKAVRKSK
jgi:hypothetical protein